MSSVEQVVSGADVGEIPVLTQGAVEEAKKPRKKRVTKKAPKARLVTPEGGYKSAVVPEFNSAIHAKLREADFSDPLEYRKWDVEYCKERLAAAERAVKEMEALGGTVDERKAAQEQMRLLENLSKLAGKLQGAQKARFIEALGGKFSDLSAG